eukprot:TRINITY_DN15502_c0_g1_i1.p1 TRINITY_DN15502_c0_g1~~TRINITY_DN15502_c0_g1_i1.p1  ORF type:complete len:324 (-),score=69.20 TRINITY_DN15502_c0_g1_i1:3-917(-)
MDIPPPPPAPKVSKIVVNNNSNNSSRDSGQDLIAKGKWIASKAERNGFKFGNPNAKIRCAIFLPEKSSHERHYDTFAYLLCRENDDFSIEQIDHKDIIDGCLRTTKYNTVIFPGGIVHDVEKALGLDGALEVCKFVNAGGAFFGVCSGGFIAGADGYSNATKEKKMIGVSVGYTPGIGTINVTFDHKAIEVFGASSEILNAKLSMYFANGPMYRPKEGTKNMFLGLDIPKAEILVRFLDFSTDKTKKPSVSNWPGAAVAADFGKGRVVAFGPHPEASGNAWVPLIKNSLIWSTRSDVKRMDVII